MRGPHELVATGLVLGPGVVLHELAHEAALGVEHGQAAADLGREGEEVELGAELAVVAALGLFEAVEVLGQGLVGLPRGAVDALEHRPVLVAPPIRTGHLHELERAQAGGGRHVGATAQVGPAVVPVDAHRTAFGAFLRVDALDDLHLEGLVGETLEALLAGELLAHERLVLAHDLPHPGLDPAEVVLAEPSSAGQVEVVVEAVLHRWADGVLGPGEQVAHRLRHHVSGGVTEDVLALVGVGGDDGHLVALVQRGAEVGVGAVDDRGDRGLGQTPADRRGEVRSSRFGRELTGGTVGKKDLHCGRGYWWRHGRPLRVSERASRR